MRRLRARDIPNALTWTRIALAPVTVACVIAGERYGGLIWPVAAAVGFWLAAALDYADGWAARRFDAASAFGRMLDPIADKVTTGAALLCLLAFGAPGFAGADFLAPAAIILGRDAVVNGMRAEAARRGRDIPSSLLAKAKTALAFFALGALLSVRALPPEGSALVLAEAGHKALWLAALFSLWTGAAYLVGVRGAHAPAETARGVRP